MQFKSSHRLVLSPLATVLALAVTGCASQLPALSGTQNVLLEGVQIATAKSGTGKPVVVFENGLSSQKEVWAAVQTEVAKTHTVFAYDRSGQGASSSSNESRIGSRIVEDLRALLKTQHLERPYVLVGHSLGGLYMQLFARKYPQEVAGLALVDSTHPLHFAGPGAMENRSLLSRSMMAIGLWGNASEEFKNTTATGKEVLCLPALPANLPTVILIAPPDSTSKHPFDAAMDAYDNAMRWDFAKLYPAASVRQTHTSHDIHGEKPELVVQAIKDVLAQSQRTAP